MKVARIRENLLKNPLVIEIAETAEADDLEQIQQVAYRVSNERKLPVFALPHKIGANGTGADFCFFHPECR